MEDIEKRVDALERIAGIVSREFGSKLDELSEETYTLTALSHQQNREIRELKQRVERIETAMKAEFGSIRQEMNTGFTQLIALIEERLPKQE